MTLTEEDKNEIRALVAEEIHNVLRREMAQWWAESVMTLAGYPRRSRRNPLTVGDAASTPDASGHSPVADGAGDGNAGEGKKRPVKPRKLGGHGGLADALGVQGTASGGETTATDVNEEYVTRVVESLLRSQEALAEQLHDAMKQLNAWLQDGR